MYIAAAFFDKKQIEQPYRIKGKYLEDFIKAVPDFKEKLAKAKSCLGYFVGKDNAQEKSVSLKLQGFDVKKDEVSLVFGGLKETDMESGHIGEGVRTVSKEHGWQGKDGLSPLIVFVSQKECETICECARRLDSMEKMMLAGDYKGVAALFEPLNEVKDDARFWDNAGILNRLGIACSKLAVTLKIKAGDTKKLDKCRGYREYCVSFLERGAGFDDSAGCASALAYRYYSNVHELTRAGERRDQDLNEQIEKANEWLSRAIEINPSSVKNNYRKGKLIIEKQTPYLLFGKKSFGEGEARLLREIREVGEEHLASAVSIYESLEEEQAKEANRREYAKALFVLGGYYLNDAYLPVYEYFFAKIAGVESAVVIQPIAKMDIESAIDNLGKCFRAESNMPLSKLDIESLAASAKEWARSPIEKLYRLGCAYGYMAFISLAGGNADKANVYAKKALYFLETAKKVSEKCTDRKRNTWHISEKIAWVYIYTGQYERAAKLLEHARSGYIINTYAIALLLAKSKDYIEKANAALKVASLDKHNLAIGMTRILLGFVTGEKISRGNLSSKNLRLARILGIEAAK